MPPRKARVAHNGRAESATPSLQGPGMRAHFDDEQLFLGPTISPGPKKKKGPRSTSPTRAIQRPQHKDHDGDVEMDRASSASVDSVDMFRSRPIKKIRVAAAETAATAAEEFDTDTKFCERMYALRDSVENFARLFPAMQDEAFFDELVHSDHAELIWYIGCLSLAGDEGEASWKKLLADGECRKALVVGIVGRAVKEDVFSALYFGPPDHLVRELQEQEILDVNHDGFYRQRRRAALIATSPAAAYDLQLAIMKVTAQFQKLLAPLYTLSAASSPAAAHALRAPLHKILTTAASLARDLKSLPDVIFHWPPTFKDEELDPARMEIRNLPAMLAASPYVRQTLPDGDVRGQLIAGQDAVSEALVRVVGFPGLITYRQGGGALARDELRYEQAGAHHVPDDVRALEQQYHGHEGFRTTLVAKTSVLLQWGKQRSLTKEAGTSRHMDAVAKGDLSRYQDGAGRKELFDIYMEFSRGTSRSPVRGALMRT